MHIHPRMLVVSGIAFGMAVSLWSVAWSQGSGSSRTSPPAAGSATSGAEEFHAKLWKFVIRSQAPYTKWPSLPGKAGLSETKPPHGPFVRLYTYKVDAEKPQDFPSGSVLVLENYTADKKTRTSIDIMYRYTGYDPQGGDWYWMEYLPTGHLATTPQSDGAKPIAGRVTSCRECHAKAQQKDYVFSNDTALETDKAGVDTPNVEKGGRD